MIDNFLLSGPECQSMQVHPDKCCILYCPVYRLQVLQGGQTRDLVGTLSGQEGIREGIVRTGYIVKESYFGY